ncbi:D-galactarate dehydratase/Altronate hydrolase,C-terminal [Moorella glycerini]|uniref:(2R)-sulfolactate sulfo-lyase subunit beta n=1 Tax=Neomoorella stamsii TaxID=1266720 RepID=A0A9X7J262_9FIRM|nr:MULTISPECIES: UxaA family hydrolase [Moorella]PRR71882.1 (2R)-sulfolactate sulfo-lyase subunit beta [Moorella stamsii]CEP66100.1 D-galactarate dehydratase/Altronate hydrolase,C-terminal [Moorella glycerini]
MTGTKFMGYRRENGSVGVRNRVVILPLDDLSNAAAEGVAKLIDGTIALPHPYGRLQFGEDLELFFRTLIGTGSNPNVAACIVIGIEPNWTNRVVEGIAKTGKPVAGFAIERYGDLKVIEMASRKAIEFVQYATELQKEECDISELVVSIKCGESDTTSGLASNPSIGNAVDRLVDMGVTVLFGETSELTGGEHLVAARCATPEIKEQFMQSFKSYNDFIISQGVDLCGSQPTEGNIAGGLTTIEEKALGNIQKIGKRAIIQGVLQPAEAPKGKGLWYMETSSAGAEAVTLFAAGGSVLHFFTTGQGNIVGNPIIPVIKISANPVTVSTMSEHIDVDLTGLLRREMDLDGAGTAILDMFIRTLNGRYTCAEALSHKEFILTKLYRSA